GVGVVAPLEDAVEDLGAGGLGQGREFLQAGLGLLHVAGGVQAGQDHALQAQLAVLDLGDVLELGGQPGHAPQGLAVGQVQLLAVGLGGEGDGVHGGVAAGEDPLGQRVTPGDGGRAVDGVLTCGATTSRYSASRDVVV